jgi:hypothetical protein
MAYAASSGFTKEAYLSCGLNCSHTYGDAMNRDDLIKLALPVSIIVAAVILYAGMTKSYTDCVNGAEDAARIMGGLEPINSAVAKQQCKK